MKKNRVSFLGDSNNLNIKKILLDGMLLPIIIILTYIIFTIIEPDFAHIGNSVNILKQSSYLIILSLAQLVVLLTRGFDLSVGNVISMISVSSAMTMVAVLKSNSGAVGSAIFLGCLVGFGIGILVGCFNGFIVSKLNVSPFITTLGMQGIALGFATTLSDGFPVFDVPVKFMNIFSKSSWLGIPVPILIAIIVILLVHLFLKYTIIGRGFYIIGSNPQAAYIAGIPVKRYLFMAYVICASITAIVALALTARTCSGEPYLGGGLMMSSMMAACIGGVSLRGGSGTVKNCILGGIFVTLLSNGMNMIRIDSYYQMIILGIVLISAIFIDRLQVR